MTDVFFCTVEPMGARTIRGQIRDLCRTVWTTRVQDSRLRWQYGLDIPNFQVARRINADHLAEGSVYVMTDDDMMPMSADIISRGLELMEKYPEFSMLSAMPASATIHPWAEGYLCDDVMEHVSVGGLRFCRKGILHKWPEFTGPGYDREHCEAIREAGYRVGYMRDVKANHLGEGKMFSTVWQ